MKIFLGSREVLMTQVGGQKRQFGIQVRSLSIPSHQGMNCERVTSIMNPRPLAPFDSHDFRLCGSVSDQFQSDGYWEVIP